MSRSETPAVAAVEAFLLDFQDRVCRALEEEDGGSRFREDVFSGEAGALARPRVLSDGAVIERATVNFSHTAGRALPGAATARGPELAGGRYDAVSVSLIVHPRNPYAPTRHANFRRSSPRRPPGMSSSKSSRRRARTLRPRSVSEKKHVSDGW